MAAVCFLDAVIPAVGIVGKALTTTCKYARVGKTIETGAKVANGIFNLARGMYNADKAVGSFCERHKDDLFTENFKWTKEDTLDAFSFGMAALTCVSSGKSLAKDLDNFMAAGDDLATLGASVGCFVAGTLIRTSEGEKKIEDIQEGDLVLSYEASEGRFAYKEVLEVVAHEGVTELAHVTIGGETIDGAYTGTETIDSTTNHPYFVVGYGFVEAGNLRPGDTILLANGENRKVDSVEIEFLDDPVTVYNFEVADWHTYFVGNTGVLVHNANIQACGDAAASAGGNGAGQSGSGTKVDIVDKEKGTFVIKDWSDYPDDYVPVPDKNKVWTFLDGGKYNDARDAANSFNRNIRLSDPYYANNRLEIHEIEPVKMGGSPTDINNKVAIQSQVHRRYVTPWWNKIRDEVKKGLNLQ